MTISLAIPQAVPPSILTRPPLIKEDEPDWVGEAEY